MYVCLHLQWLAQGCSKGQATCQHFLPASLTGTTGTSSHREPLRPGQMLAVGSPAKCPKMTKDRIIGAGRGQHPLLYTCI